MTIYSRLTARYELWIKLDDENTFMLRLLKDTYMIPANGFSP